MKIIECSPFRDEEGKISPLQLINGMLEYGINWRTLVKSEDLAIKRLQRTLDKEYTLFRDFAVPGIDAKNCIMVLLGPQGILIMMAKPLKGIYRAKGTEWMIFDQRSRKFKKSKPNFQEIILNSATILKKSLENEGLALIDIETILLFTNPRTLVDTARPRVRIVPADAVDYFSANLQQLPEILDKEDIKYLTELLLRNTQPSEEDPEETGVFPEEPAALLESGYEPDFLEDDTFFPDIIEEEQIEAKPKRRGLLFERKQWMIIGLLILLELIILGLFAVLVFSNFNLPL
ncbi:MAG: hypothetical protein JXA25_05150 [Anaerolineales bacterium]|nr:hypothetical protein [Anaerolineales bacterium]